MGGAVKRLRDNPERFAEIARPFLRAAIAVADNDDDGAASLPAVERALKVLGASAESASLAAGAWMRTMTAGSPRRMRWPRSPSTSR